MTGAIYDAQFIETETSRGTPGGTLTTLQAVLAQQALIMEKLGIAAPEFVQSEDETEAAG